MAAPKISYGADAGMQQTPGGAATAGAGMGMPRAGGPATAGQKGGKRPQQQRRQNMQPSQAGFGKTFAMTPPGTFNTGMQTSAPPAGNPATSGNKGSGGQGGPNYQGTLNSQFGQGNPFGMQGWYGGNPLQTAQDLATRNLQKQLGSVRARYGASGLGNSSREAIAEGTALGDFGTGLGDVLAQRGLGAYESDANRGLQAMLGAGQQDLQANQQLANLGTGLTGIGSSEQQIPGMSAIMNLLNALTGQDLTSSFHQAGGGGYWT